MVQGAMALIKYFIFVFNFLFWLSGLALIVLGSYLQYHNVYYADFLGSRMFTVPIVIILLGCIISGMGFLGCWGAIRENYKVLMTFSIILTFICLAEFTSAIVAYAMRYTLKEGLRSRVMVTMTKYPNKTAKMNIWDRVQRNFNCCGVENFTDWQKNTIFYKSGELLPSSCCILEMDNKNVSALFTCNRFSPFLRHDGCWKRFSSWAGNNLVMITIIVMFFAFIQMLGILFGCCLAKSIRKEFNYFY